jgi:hypothetical protein
MMLTIMTCNRPQNLMFMKRSPRIQFAMLSNKLFGRVSRQRWGKKNFLKHVSARTRRYGRRRVSEEKVISVKRWWPLHEGDLKPNLVGRR